MSNTSIGVISILFLLLLIALRIHVGISLAITGFLGIFLLTGKLEIAMGVLTTTPYFTVAQYAMAVVPLFILMGMWVGTAGIAEGAYKAAGKWMGRMPGGWRWRPWLPIQFLALPVAQAWWPAPCLPSSAFAPVTGIFQDGVAVLRNGQRELLHGYNNIVIAMGSKSVNELCGQLRGKVPELHCIGDAAKPQKILEALNDALEVGLII